MEQTPPNNQPPKLPRAPHNVPKIQDTLGLNAPKRIGEAIDAIAPPYIEQEADATRAVARDLDVTEHPTDQQRYGVPVSEWRMGEEVVFVGPAESERARLALRFADQMMRNRGAAELAPPSIDDIRFGRGNRGRTVIGEVVARKTPSLPPKAPRLRNLFRRIDARHAAPPKEWNWRRRVAAGAAAALALTSAVFFVGNSGHDEVTPKPRPTYSAPDYTATPDKSKPTIPAEKAFQFSFEDGNNSYVYTTNESGTVTQIAGTLGEGENPWTLTEGAYKILMEDDQINQKDIAQSDPFMQSPQAQQQSRQLHAGTRIVWQPINRGEHRVLKA